MKTEEAVYRKLYAELENYESKGIDILMENDCLGRSLEQIPLCRSE